MSGVRFDESLPAFVGFLLAHFDAEVIRDGLFLREASGHLTFVTTPRALESVDQKLISKAAAAELAPYVHDDGFGVATSEDLFDDTLKNPLAGWRQAVELPSFSGDVRLLDRRVVGADWLTAPRELASPPRLIFASLKGGVGRTTALCVLASALASRGQRVLAIDMDIEAPGLGSMLLSATTLPTLGLLDYLVESAVADTDVDLLSEMIAPSWLSAGAGVLDVLPALGRTTEAFPRNALSKLARAYLTSDGGGGVSARISSLLAQVESTSAYDVILIDARAGLHETTAASVLGTGGKILLFGINQPQTFSGFDLLFANLALLGPITWEDRLTVIQAKFSGLEADHSSFSSEMRQRLGRWFTPAEPDLTPDLAGLRHVFEVEWVEDGPASNGADSFLRVAEQLESFQISHILESESFREFDPLRSPDRLSPEIYQAVFGTFLATAYSMLNLEDVA